MSALSVKPGLLFLTGEELMLKHRFAILRQTFDVGLRIVGHLPDKVKPQSTAGSIQQIQLRWGSLMTTCLKEYDSIYSSVTSLQQKV